MNDTKEFYIDQMHKMGVKMVISSGFDWNDIEERPFKFNGRTINRPRFIKNRDILAKKYFYPHKLIKNIFLQAKSVLPEFICDFTKYRTPDFILPTT